MTDHLPECDVLHIADDDDGAFCICRQLRACEQRVREDEHIRTLDYVQTGNTVMNVFGTYYGQGYADGVQAARDAVEAVGQQHPKWDLMSTHYEDCWKHHSECALTLALAAIDALRESTPDLIPTDKYWRTNHLSGGGASRDGSAVVTGDVHIHYGGDA